jgi:hypothetical protein
MSFIAGLVVLAGIGFFTFNNVSKTMGHPQNVIQPMKHTAG